MSFQIFDCLKTIARQTIRILIKLNAFVLHLASSHHFYMYGDYVSYS